ncbi:hypothetical protein V8E54_014708 [Elaphomyces granulatus]
MSADTFNSQLFSVCNHCQGCLEYESDKKQNGNWYKLCSHCRSSARDYQRCRREKRATDEPDLSNRPQKVRVIQPRPTPVPADNAMGNDQPSKRPRGRPRKYTEEALAPEVQSRPRGQPRKYTEEVAGPEVQSRPRGQPRKYTEEALAGPEVQPRPCGQRQKVIPEQETHGAAGMQPTTLDQAELERTRKDLVDARVQFEDDRWLQKQRDSDLRAWCKPVTRDVQLDAVQSFYKAMHDETTLEIEYCVVCGLQKASKDLEEYMWEEFHLRPGRASFTS